MADREKVIKEFADYVHYFKPYCIGDIEDHEMLKDVLELLKEQEEIEGRYIEAFNTIRDAYNAQPNREKILHDYLARNACCCEKLLIGSGEFADMPTMQSAT